MDKQITGKQLGGLLFAIHTHADDGEGEIMYRERDLLPILEAIGLPKVEWGECFSVKQYKQEKKEARLAKKASKSVETITPTSPI